MLCIWATKDYILHWILDKINKFSVNNYDEAKNNAMNLFTNFCTMFFCRNRKIRVFHLQSWLVVWEDGRDWLKQKERNRLKTRKGKRMNCCTLKFPFSFVCLFICSTSISVPLNENVSIEIINVIINLP